MKDSKSDFLFQNKNRSQPSYEVDMYTQATLEDLCLKLRMPNLQ